MYHFELASKVCDQFNRLINTLKKEEEETCDTDRYQWLDDSDKRKHMTDKEILDKYIDLEGSCLTKQEKQKLRGLIYDYKDAFSLRDEIGMCPNIKVEIDVMDNSPFFIRPFHAKEEDKAILDKEIKMLCYLGNLKEGFSAYSSLVMLISRKVTQDKRVVTDFRHLNMRIAKNNLAYPLLKDMFTLLRGSKCEVLLVLDLKDAFHSLRLTESSKKYCGILLYFGSTLYLYQRMPMGLNISPTILQSYINAILSCLSSRKYCEAIMDDLLLFMPNKQTHFEKLIDLLQALCKNSWKISPKKCQLFKTEWQYIGNTIFIKEKRVCVKPLRSRLEAIQKLKPPMNQKGCRSFADIVNFVNIFCPELQKLLKPIYELTKKGRLFIWGDEQQKAFEEIKRRLLKPPVLSMPDKGGRFVLYSDTSKYTTGSSLYSLFFIRPFHAKEEDKAILDREMKMLCYLGILKEGFSAYSSLVMLISRKVTQDKRVVTDFRHLNMRIAKNNLAYPLLKDMFTLLRGSKCEVLLVLDLKDAFHSLRLTESSKKYCGILLYFGSTLYLYQRMPMGLNISPHNIAIIH